MSFFVVLKTESLDHQKVPFYSLVEGLDSETVKVNVYKQMSI